MNTTTITQIRTDVTAILAEVGLTVQAATLSEDGRHYMIQFDYKTMTHPYCAKGRAQRVAVSKSLFVNTKNLGAYDKEGTLYWQV